jgi:hypothetical protein
VIRVTAVAACCYLAGALGALAGLYLRAMAIEDPETDE